MAQIEIRLPKMGESVTEATITNWLKNIGDSVAMDEPLVEVATDKVDNELPSEAAGVLIKKFFEKDEVAQVGDVIALIGTEGDTGSPENIPAAALQEIPQAIDVATQAVEAAIEMTSPAIINDGTRFYSPLVKSIAAKENISQTDLDTINGSGLAGRVTKKDVLEFLNNKANSPSIAATTEHSKIETPTIVAPTSNGSAKSASSVPTVSAPTGANPGYSFIQVKDPIVLPMPGDEIIEMDRMRKLISEHMVMSTHVSPHVTSFVEADVTNIVNWRNKIKKDYEKREGESLTFTPIFIEAVVKAIKDFPMINVCIDGNKIIKRKDINVGMAAALPSGNLIVPVIKQADRLNLVGISKAVNELANNARNGKLKPEDIQGGTYTVSNVGTFGNVMGTPIINQPQVAILALGAIRKMPAVIETPQGDFIGIRHKMFLSHSYDHRVVDGALGGMFVKRVADYLEQFDENREL